MSTRCCVKVVKKFNDDNVKEVMIYHHHDGYPEGVGADLVNRSKEKWDKYANGWDIDLIVNDLVKDTDEEYEITCYNHVDIEYLYTIDCDNKDIKCNAARWDMQEKDGEYISQSIIEEEVAIPGYKEKKEGEPDPAFETIQALGHKIEKEENGYNIEILNAPHDGTYFIHITDKHNVVSELEDAERSFDEDEYVRVHLNTIGFHPTARQMLEDTEYFLNELRTMITDVSKAIEKYNKR